MKLTKTYLLLGFLVFMGMAFVAGVYIGGQSTPRDVIVSNGEAWGVSIGDSPSQMLQGLEDSYPDAEVTVVIYRDHPPKFEVVRGLENLQAAHLGDAREIAVLGVGQGASELFISFQDGRVTRLLMRERAYDL